MKRNVERFARKKYGQDETAKANYVQDVCSRVKTTSDYKEAVKNADLIIEAIVENLEAKQQLFSSLDKVQLPLKVFKKK